MGDRPKDMEQRERLTMPPADEGRGGRREVRRRIARKGVAVLPTLLTLGNVLCGFASIFAASRAWMFADQVGSPELPFGWTALTFAALFVFLGMILDGLDGRVARLTRSHSDLGEQLDSMADLVTFGVAPPFIAVQLMGVGAPFLSGQDLLFDRVALVIAFIYVACAALRLARFNIEVEDGSIHSHLDFKGLPTPGAAGTVVSLVLLHEHFLANMPEAHWTMNWAALAMVAVMALAALAMVSSFRYVHLTNRYVRGRAPVETIAQGVILALLLLIHLQGALAAGFVCYALSAPAAALRQWAQRGRRTVRNNGKGGG